MQRETEMTSNDLVIGNQMQLSAPVLIQQTPIEAVRRYLATIRAVVALLNAKTLRQVIDIKVSKRLI